VVLSRVGDFHERVIRAGTASAVNENCARRTEKTPRQACAVVHVKNHIHEV
jgi:hypothetical protein